MSHADYCKLIDRICEIKRIPDPSLRHRRFNLTVEGAHFTLLPMGEVGSGDLDSVAYFCDFGSLPEEQKAMVLLRLLETNLYMFGRDTPSFTCNPDNGHVVLAGRMPLQRINAEAALKALAGIAEFAGQWQETYFLTSQERGPRGPTRGAAADVFRRSAATLVGRGAAAS